MLFQISKIHISPSLYSRPKIDRATYLKATECYLSVVLCSAFIQNSSDSSGDLTNWSVTHCFGVIYCNWCFYLVPRPSKAIASVCRKTCSPVGCIDSGYWLILLYWHVLMLSLCLTNTLLCIAKSTPCTLLKMRIRSMFFFIFFYFTMLQWTGNKEVFFWCEWVRVFFLTQFLNLHIWSCFKAQTSPSSCGLQWRLQFFVREKTVMLPVRLCILTLKCSNLVKIWPVQNSMGRPSHLVNDSLCINMIGLIGFHIHGGWRCIHIH